jgi:hypothetical protein
MSQDPNYSSETERLEISQNIPSASFLTPPQRSRSIMNSNASASSVSLFPISNSATGSPMSQGSTSDTASIASSSQSSEYSAPSTPEKLRQNILIRKEVYGKRVLFDEPPSLQGSPVGGASAAPVRSRGLFFSQEYGRALQQLQDDDPEEFVASRREENVASRREENVASRREENVASHRREENVASRREENVASRREENVASRREENVASRREENVASRREDSDLLRSSTSHRREENGASHRREEGV